MERQDGDDPGCVIAPDHGIATKPIIDIKTSGPSATDADKTTVITNRPLDVGMRQDRIDEALGNATLRCASQAVIGVYHRILHLGCSEHEA
jgi:hypothetical protein